MGALDTLWICVSIVLTGVALASTFWWAYNREKTALLDSLDSFLSRPTPEKPSPLEQMVSMLAAALSDQIKAHLSAAMMGHASAASKQLDGIAQDTMQDSLAAQNPLMAALLSFSPSLRKRVTKNPIAAMALSSLNLDGLLSRLGGVPGNGNGSNHAMRGAGSPQTKFDLGV